MRGLGTLHRRRARLANEGLSVRRARAVQAELIKDGVPPAAITIQGFGDTHCWCRPVPACASPEQVEIIIRCPRRWAATASVRSADQHASCRASPRLLANPLVD
jgi:outer membrane protein OmpA-like peptidoglycan-associated protein